jgi:two-component system C4-dicarboxylate transport sensor histidine kinase DctB
MFILIALPPLAPLPEALLDGLMITVMVSPFLYLFLFRPMVLHIESRQRMRADLQTLNATLEERIAERTADLSAANDRLKEQIEVRKQTENDLWKTGAGSIDAGRRSSGGRARWRENGSA